MSQRDIFEESGEIDFSQFICLSNGEQIAVDDIGLPLDVISISSTDSFDLISISSSENLGSIELHQSPRMLSSQQDMFADSVAMEENKILSSQQDMFADSFAMEENKILSSQQDMFANSLVAEENNKILTSQQDMFADSLVEDEINNDGLNVSQAIEKEDRTTSVLPRRIYCPHCGLFFDNVSDD